MSEQRPAVPPSPQRREPGRGGRAETVARVALVLLLLGVAALGLSGRRRLDWGALSDAPGSTWTGLLLIAAAAFVVVASLHTLARMLRVSRESDDEPAPAIEGSRVTWLGYLAAAAVVAVAVFLVYLLVKSAIEVPAQLPEQDQVNSAGTPRNAPTQPLSSTDKWALLGAVLAGAALAVVFAVLRRRSELADAAEQVDEEAAEQEALAEAVAAAEVELDSHGDDTRAAIIAAYLAMERQLMASGVARQPSDTPTDFLLRAMAAARVSRGSASRLTDLFREARFSTHPMADSARSDASRALARVADDLAHDANRQPNPGAGSRG